MAVQDRKQLINLHSSQDKKPVGKLSLGEFANVHPNTTDAKIFLETVENSTSETTLAVFITDRAIDNKITSATTVILDIVDNLADVVAQNTLTGVSGDTIITPTLLSGESGKTLTITHKAAENLTNGLNKVAFDGFGHITGTTAVTMDDISGLEGFDDAVYTVVSGALLNYYTKEDIDNKHFVNSGEVKTQIEAYGYTTNTGTIEGVNMNGASKGTSGVVDLGTVVVGVTLNGSAQTVTDGVVDLTVATEHAKHALEANNGTAVSETGHQITFVESLSGTPTPTDGNLQVNAMRKTITIPSTAAEVGALPTGTTLDDIPDGTTRKLSDYENVIEVVQVNGSALTVTNKTVNVPVPTKLSELTNDAYFVTDEHYVHTDNNYTTAEKTKLSGISEGAEENVQSNWSETSTTSDAYILNKPTSNTAFTNDAGYITSADTEDFVTSADVKTQIEEYHYITSADTEDFFDGVEYVSSAKTINFKHGEEIKGTIDATDFIKDGMVNNAYVDTPSGGTHSGETCLIITFNTDAGKEDIEIPLSNIFNPDNYYTKQEISDKELVVAQALNELNDAISGVAADVQTLSGTIGDIKTDLETLSGSVIELSGSVIDFSGSVVENYYTKEECNNLFVSLSAYAEDEEVISEALNDLDERITIISANTANISEFEEELAELESAYTEQMLVISESLNDLNERIDDLGFEYVTLEQFEENEFAVASSLNDLNERINDIGDNFYTKDETDNLFMSLSGFEEEELVIAAALNTLNTRINEVSAITESIPEIEEEIEDIKGQLSGVTFDGYTKQESNNLFMSISAYVRDEKVIAAAFNDINTRLLNLSGSVVTVMDDVIESIGPELDALSDAIEDLSEQTTQDIESLSGAVVDNYYTKDEMSDKERIITAALNDLNERIDEVAEEASSLEGLEGLSGQVASNTRYINSISGNVITGEKIISDRETLSGITQSGSVVDATLINTLLNNLIERTEYEDDLYVISQAFNDMNDRINALEMAMMSGTTISGGDY